MVGQLVRESDADLFGTTGTATFDESRAYRYELTREWGDGPAMAFVMLNPSKANAFDNDPTISRCVAGAIRSACGSLLVVNLFALQSTDPRALKVSADPVGSNNDNLILDACTRAALVVAAWGSGGMLNGRGRRVADLLADHGIKLFCLGVTRDGQPRHPLYVRSDQPLVPYEPEGMAADGLEDGS